MKRIRLLMVVLVLFSAALAPVTSLAQDQGSAPASEPEAISLSLNDVVREAFRNNRTVRVSSYVPEFRANDLLFQKAQFDAAVTASASYLDASDPSLTFCDEGSFSLPPGIPGRCTSLGQVRDVPNDSTTSILQGTFSDRLHFGTLWSANVQAVRRTVEALNFGFVSFSATVPEVYTTQFDLSLTQPLLKNFGRKANETFITIAANDELAAKEDFKITVIDRLQEVQDSYWTLVFARQDLEVRNEALRLAQELLKLNQIKVQVGTLPPIDIIQAEAGVASREEAVVTAAAAIETAEDRLRFVMGLDPTSPQWKTRIIPTEDTTIADRPVDPDEEVKKAIENRPELARLRIDLQSADATLAYRKNQLRYSLDFSARYTLQGIAGDTRATVPDPNAGVPYVPPNNAADIFDAFEFIPGLDYPTYEVRLTLGIPLGNNAEEALYSNSRLAKEQLSITYQSIEQATTVEVALAVRRVVTDRKRIEAAEKSRVLQERKVEAEQKKFENGLSTSFQVLTFQNDLAEARSAENRAKTDYRISLSALDKSTGTLDKALNVQIQDYTRNGTTNSTRKGQESTVPKG